MQLLFLVNTNSQHASSGEVLFSTMRFLSSVMFSSVQGWYGAASDCDVNTESYSTIGVKYGSDTDDAP